MHSDKYILAMSDFAKSLIESGEAYRQGGVVYATKGGIIEHLHDAEILKSSAPSIQNLVSASMIPMAIFAASMLAINHRLAKIEAALHELKTQIQEVKTELQLANFKLDSQLLGKLNGTIHACQIDIKEGRNSRLDGYRQSFLESYYSIKEFVFCMATAKDSLKNHEQLFKQYMRAMLLSGLAARDLSYRMKEYDTTVSLSKTLATDTEDLKNIVYKNIDNISALFWRKDEHIDIAIELRESYERLLSHTVMLKELPKQSLNLLLNSQIDI